MPINISDDELRLNAAIDLTDVTESDLTKLISAAYSELGRRENFGLPSMHTYSDVAAALARCVALAGGEAKPETSTSGAVMFWDLTVPGIDFIDDPNSYVYTRLVGYWRGEHSIHLPYIAGTSKVYNQKDFDAMSVEVVRGATHV